MADTIHQSNLLIPCPYSDAYSELIPTLLLPHHLLDEKV